MEEGVKNTGEGLRRPERAIATMMAIGSALAMACFLIATGANAIEEASTVTCGSVLKLEHKATKYRLHSEDVTYGTGSGQHSVTGNPQATEGASYWIVRGPLGTPCDQGTPLENGAIIRLQHSQSKRWLHSHLFRSPLSGQQEVSSFGGAEESDTGDNWKLEISGKGPWKQNQEIQLQHVDTKAYLMSHTKKFGQPIAGQYEVCATQGRPNANTKWMAAEGVYFSPQEGTCS